MVLELKTSIDIDASPDAIWEVLSDLPSYPSWNPFIRELRGRLSTGERLELRMQPVGGKAIRFRPTVLAAEPARELRWLGRLVMPGVLDGEHRFAIEPTATGSRLTHEERFSGVLVPLFAKGLRRRYLPAFEEMNAALAARVAA